MLRGIIIYALLVYRGLKKQTNVTREYLFLYLLLIHTIHFQIEKTVVHDLLANLKDDRLEDKQWTSRSNNGQRLTGEYGVAKAAYSTCQ